MEMIDPTLETQVAAARARGRKPLATREAYARGVTIALLLASVGLLAMAGGTGKSPEWWWYPILVIEYALLSYEQFEIGNGAALPTGIVFVPMLFVLPPASVPLVVAAALILSSMPAFFRREISLTRALSAPASAFFAVGPAAVFVLAGDVKPDARGGLILVVAIAAQFACDAVAAASLEFVALGASPRQLVRPLATTFAIDALVSPLGFLVAVAMQLEAWAIALPLPLVGLLALLVRERTERLDSLLELSSAYRGTAFLLGDVVEADDAYTGEHSRQVVELVAAVSSAMKLGPSELRMAELAALLHDVGKIRIPKDVINKRGPLDAHEWALIKQHTIEGEQLLERVGGLIATVGHIVRSCHERWDGTGYPDGLKESEIPLVARIVCCCDAYNAMTTTRPYRPAMSPREALAEVVANSGTQFDPAVVAALVTVRSRTAEPQMERPLLHAVAESVVA